MKQLAPRPVAFLFSLAGLLASCGTGRTMILQAPDREYRIPTYRLEQSGSTAAVPAGIRTRFEAAVNKIILATGMKTGEALTLRYRFIQFEEGDQFARWFWGGIGNSGEASLTTEVVFLDSTGKELAKIQSEGRIGSGFFGGTLNEAIEKMAEEVADYTIKNFAQEGLTPVKPPPSEAGPEV